MGRFAYAFYALLTLTILTAGAAWFLVQQQQQQQAVKHFEPFLLFPKLTQQINKVGLIRIDVGRGLAKTQHITLVKNTKNSIFRVKEADGFPASPQLVQQLLYGMTALKAVAAHTSTQEGVRRLGLLEPEKLGPSIRISLYGFPQMHDDKKSRTTFASILLGKRPQSAGEVLGLASIYARRQGQLQSYLVRGALPLRTTIDRWLHLEFLKTALQQKINGKQAFIVSKVQFSPPQQSAWIMRRSQPQKKLFLTDRRAIPLPGQVRQQRAQSLADLPKKLTFLNVRPAQHFRFRNPHIAIYEYFSGLALIFEIILTPQGFWAKINARTTNRSAQIIAEKLQTHFDGFAFLIPPAQARAMMINSKYLTKQNKKKKKRKN